jgi:hypothetical protein
LPNSRLFGAKGAAFKLSLGQRPRFIAKKMVSAESAIRFLTNISIRSPVLKRAFSACLRAISISWAMPQAHEAAPLAVHYTRTSNIALWPEPRSVVK